MQTLREFEGPVLLANGPNEGIINLAGGQGFTPSFETHNHDSSLPEQTVSRLWWRRIINNRVAQMAFVAMTLNGSVTACGAESDHPPTTITTNEQQPISSLPEQDPSCYQNFSQLSAIDQEECRQLIADMDTNDIRKLSPLDHARWAGYYRFEKLGETMPVHLELAAVVSSKNQSLLHSVASRLLGRHEENIFKMAWLLQNNPTMCADNRTQEALLGETGIPEIAQALTTQFPANGQTVHAYALDLQKRIRLFDEIDLQSPKNSKQGDRYALTFETTTKSAKVPVHFTFSFMPYMDAIKEGNTFKEGFLPLDPTLSKDQQQELAKLQEKLLVAPPKITR